MRAAPSVQALACGAGAWRLLQLALYALSGWVLVYWAGSHFWAGTRSVVLASLGAAALATALAALGLRQVAWRLAWDGSHWTVGLPSLGRQAGSVTLMLDLGGWMLVRFVPDMPPGAAGRRSLWLALRARDNAAAWLDLRVALHAWRQAQGGPSAASRVWPSA